MTKPPDPVKEAERQIQRILIELEANHGVRIEAVEVDLHQFANFTVSIFTPLNLRKSG